MKRLLITIAILLSLEVAYASHIIGGEMRYEYVGPGATPNSKIYRIVLILFKGNTILNGLLLTSRTFAPSPKSECLRAWPPKNSAAAPAQ